jgi:hypothetical protein
LFIRFSTPENHGLMISTRMRRMVTVHLVPAIIALACALVADEVGAQAITVAPVDPLISVGQTLLFTATGISTATAVEAGGFQHLRCP